MKMNLKIRGAMLGVLFASRQQGEQGSAFLAMRPAHAAGAT